MRVKSLYLDNVAGFKDFKIEFEPNRNAIFGVNGIGKTTILNSIASFFYKIDKRKKILPMFIKNEFFDSKNSFFELEIEYEVYIKEQSLFEENRKTKNIFRCNNRDLDSIDKFQNEIEESSKIIYFTAYRFFSEIYSTPKPKINKNKSIFQVYDQNSTSFSSPNKIHEYMVDIYIADAINVMEKQNNPAHMKELKELVKQVLHNKEFETVSKENPDYYDVIFKDSENNRFTLFELSHGEKLILMFLMEFHKNKWKDSIVLIDEPEMSLHPDWQIKLIPILEKLGKNNQFIIATHSTKIIYPFEEDEVLYLGE